MLKYAQSILKYTNCIHCQLDFQINFHIKFRSVSSSNVNYKQRFECFAFSEGSNDNFNVGYTAASCVYPDAVKVLQFQYSTTIGDKMSGYEIFLEATETALGVCLDLPLFTFHFPFHHSIT